MLNKILAYYANPTPTTLLLVGVVAAVGAVRKNSESARYPTYRY